MLIRLRRLAAEKPIIEAAGSLGAGREGAEKKPSWDVSILVELGRITVADNLANADFHHCLWMARQRGRRFGFEAPRSGDQIGMSFSARAG
jgi:hypothetical protein